MAGNIVGPIKSELDDSFGLAAAIVTESHTDQTQRIAGAAIPAVLAAILCSAATPAISNPFAFAGRTG